jgi:hypothetical protein
VATITTKFSLGDRVWKIAPTIETIKLPCRFCRGRGWLATKGANGQSWSVKCPECDVNATITLGSWPLWRVESEQLTVGMIKVQVVAEGPDNGEDADNRNPARAGRVGGGDAEDYMCWSTGVGSGSVHHVEDLFSNLEKAKGEAEARTKRARAGEKPGGRDQWRQWWPDAEQVRVATGFLDHRDIYENYAGYVALAEAIVEVAQRRAAGQEG